MLPVWGGSLYNWNGLSPMLWAWKALRTPVSHARADFMGVHPCSYMESHTWKGLAFGLMLNCCHFEILKNFRTRDLEFSLYAGH